MSLVKKVALATALTATAAGASDLTTQNNGSGEPTVVLVRGAFADGSAWRKVIPLLQAKGLKVVAAQNPLTSLSDDVAATRRTIDSQTGPIVLVGHSYGGAVITEAGNDERVVSLVYVAAFAPSEGQSIADLNKGYPVSGGSGEMEASKDGFVKLTPTGVSKFLAQDVPADETAIMAATQQPIRGANFAETAGVPAWQAKQSWYIVAKHDHMIHPDLQKAMAEKIKATTVTLATSHVPHISQPAEVAAVIFDAVSKIEN